MIIYNENNTNNMYTHEITIRENSQYTRYIVQRTLITSTLNRVAWLFINRRIYQQSQWRHAV